MSRPPVLASDEPRTASTPRGVDEQILLRLGLVPDDPPTGAEDAPTVSDAPAGWSGRAPVAEIQVSGRRRAPRDVVRVTAWRIRLGDVVTVATAAIAAFPWNPGLAWTAGLALPLPLLVWSLGGGAVRGLRSGDVGRAAVARAVVLWAIGALVVTVLVDGRPPAVLVLGALPAATVGMLLVRWLASRRLQHAARRGLVTRRALLVGTDAEVAAWWKREGPRGLYEVVGRCGGDGTVFSHLGAEANAADVVGQHGIDVVVVAGGLPEERMRRLVRNVGETTADLIVCPGLVELHSARARLLAADDGWEVRLLIHPRRGSALAKAALDRTLGTLILLVAAPLIAVAALAVVTTSRGGAFYAQTRVGRDGTPFRMWKLRSMVKDADRLKASLAGANEHDGVMFKMRQDPRVTKVGAVLRRYSIDELPQLWNVVRGDMSLVGPRPPLPDETARYAGEEPRRLRVKPGLTGLWQIGGRSDLSWADSVRLDLRYVDNWCVALDLRILAATVRAVLSRRGAY